MNPATAKIHEMPTVSCLVATRNRRPFLAMLLECVRAQTYPLDKVELLVCDDGTDPVADVFAAPSCAGAATIDYWHTGAPITLGAKRNAMNARARGDVLVYLDDDDYYPPSRIMHAVATLAANPQTLVAGCSTMYMYFPCFKRIMKCGPYGANHCTAATMAFKRELLEQTAYSEADLVGEEKAFLRGQPVAQMDPMKTILAMSHDHSSCDKAHMVAQPHRFQIRMTDHVLPEHFGMSAAAVQFYMTDVHAALAQFPAGSREACKADILKDVRSRVVT
jgi:hypothetical protein